MKKFYISFVTFTCLLICNSLWAMDIPSATTTVLSQSTQLLLVTADNSNSLTAILQRYQRNHPSASWSKVGAPIAVVLGKKGLAWGGTIAKPAAAEITLDKKEGDSRTPIGVFALGPAFGFAPGDPQLKLDYLALTPYSVCVDDQKSTYYNQIIDSSQVAKNSWRSGEQMHEVPGYKMGAVIQYNQVQTKPGAGSCIFLHIWRDANTGTAGCVATTAENLKEILTWLDPRKQPMIAIFPAHYSAAMTKS